MAGDNTPTPADSAAGLRILEGYLYWQAETDRARHDAEEFADKLPWLTTAQREDVVRLYRLERVEASRAYVDRIAGRCQLLQRQYTARYQQLKIRVLGAAVALALCLCVAERLLATP